jgi:hypothetical protein
VNDGLEDGKDAEGSGRSLFNIISRHLPISSEK